MMSTFGAELTSLKKSVEEDIACRYYCYFFSAKVTKLTVIYEDNVAVVMNSTNPRSALQHKSILL